MSHFSKITAEIKDLDVLKKTVESMGFEFKENGNCRYYYGTKKSDFVIKLPGQYDVAIRKSKQGDNYSVEADMWGGHVAQYVGENAKLLMQNYTIEKIKAEVSRENLAIMGKEQQGENIALKIVDPETGGTINAVCSSDGSISWQTSGFTGTGCMKFQNLEKSLGTVEKTTYTSEYYAEEPETGIETVNEIISD